MVCTTCTYIGTVVRASAIGFPLSLLNWARPRHTERNLSLSATAVRIKQRYKELPVKLRPYYPQKCGLERDCGLVVIWSWSVHRKNSVRFFQSLIFSLGLKKYESRLVVTTLGEVNHKVLFCVLCNSSWADLLSYTVKKAFRYSRPQPGCQKPNSPWTGIIYKWRHNSRPGRVW